MKAQVLLDCTRREEDFTVTRHHEEEAVESLKTNISINHSTSGIHAKDQEYYIWAEVGSDCHQLRYIKDC